MTDYNDGKIHGWNGGDCPVHPETVVKYWTLEGGPLEQRGEVLAWRHNGGSGDIIAFRVVKQYVEPKTIWVNEYAGSNVGWFSESDAKYYAGITATRIAVEYREVKK